MNAIRVVIFFLSFLSSHQAFTAIKGSETAVSIEPAYTFPAADSDNLMQGFGWFKNGFSLEDSSTTCTFDSVFPVSGSIDMNGGTLYILQDLVLRNVLQLNELGTIHGHNHLLDLCSIPALPSGLITLNTIKIELHQDLILTDTVLIQGNCTINAFGKIIDLQSGGTILVDSNSHLAICDAELRGVQGENVLCADDSGRLTLDNVLWIQDNATEFKKGSILFKDQVDFVGSFTFSYSSMQTSTIGISSRFSIGSDMHLCLGRHPDTLQEPIAFADSTSCLHLDNCSLVISYSGICLTKGTISLAREVTLDALGTTTQAGLIIGDGSVENDMTVWFEPGAAVTHNSGYWVYNNSQKDLLKSCSKSARMIRNLGSKIYVPQSLELNDITVQLNSNLVAPIQVEPTAQLSYMGAAVSLPDIDFEITSDQLNAYTYCLNGNDSIVLGNGTLPLYMVVMGAGNQVCGNGGITGGITLMDSGADLTCGINGFIDNVITLNGGTFKINYDLFMCRNASFVGPGIVDLVGNEINFESGQAVDSSILWQGDKGTLLFNGKVSLSQTWTIQGNCRIVGNDAKLVLEEGGNIVIEKDSSLTIKSIPVYGIKDQNIRCVDDTGVITLLKSDLILEDDYLFSNGTMNFYLENSISGAYTFSYDSAIPSTIKKDGHVYFGDDITIAIGKKNGLDQVVFEDSGSIFKLNNANLLVHETGLQLTKGTLFLDGRVNLDMNGTTTQTGLIIGDGTVENDVDVVLSPAMVVSHNSGYWVYNNVVSNKIKSTSPAARLVRNGSSRIYLPRSLHAENFTVELTSLLVNPVEVDPTASVSYAHAYVKMPTIEFDANCSQLNAYTYYLSGNNSVFITKGILPLYLLVQGVGNSLIGNGSLSGGIIFADSSSALSCGLGGIIDNYINLNGSTLSLSGDLYLGTNGSLNGPGVVNLGKNEFSYAINTQNLTTPIYWISDDGGINVRGTVSLSSTWTIKGTCKINGINSKFALDTGGQIVVDTDSELILENIRLYGLQDENIRCVDDTGKITLINSEFAQTGDTIFSKGSMEMYLKNTVSGAYTFSYESVMTSTIKSDGQCSIKDGVTMICGRTNGNEPIYLEDSSSTIKFQDATFQVKETGMRLTNGLVIADRNVVVDVVGTTSDTGLIFGNGNPAHDIVLSINPGATAQFPRGFVQYDITVPNGIRSKTKTAELIRGAQSHFDLKQHVDLANMTVDVHLYSTLSIDPGKFLSYTNGRIVLPQGVFDLSGVRYNDVTSLLDGDDKIVLINGSLPLATLVAGTNNTIEGNGTITGPIFLSNAGTELTFNLNGSLLNNVALAQGKLIFENDLYVGNGFLFTGDGVVQLQEHNIELGKADIAWPGNVFWDVNGGSVSLDANLDLQGTWTFKGVGEIKGHGQTINLSAGRIVVDEGSQLTLQDVQLEGLNCGHLKCLGDDSVFILDNVIVNQQDDHVSFNKGALRFKNKVTFYGNSIFSYETNQTSTVCSDSMLMFDHGMTFSYDPNPAANNKIEFENRSSSLMLRCATLHSTVTGLQLTKGTFDVHGDSHVYVEREETEDEFGKISVIDNGIIFGDGTAGNDINLFIRGGSYLCVLNGSLVYNNISPDAFFAENNLSTIRLLTGVRLRVNQDFDLGNGRVVMKQSANIIKESGKDISGTILIEE